MDINKKLSIISVVITFFFTSLWVHAGVTSYIKEDAFHFYMFAVLFLSYLTVGIIGTYKIIKNR